MRSLPCVMTIAGSDSGGGAGIQADLKGISARGVHAATAITAITAQNSREVTMVHPLPPDVVEAQIDAVMSDMRPVAVKIGMLGTSELVRTIAAKLRQWQPDFIVLDPVMIASSGAKLLEDDAVEALRSELLPIATIATPNWPEAETLAGLSAGDRRALPELCEAMRRCGIESVLFKGGHLPGEEVVDVLWTDDSITEFRNPRIPDAEGHGTGCTLASAIAAGLALGESLSEACDEAIGIVRRALQARYQTGPSKPLFLATLRS